MWPWIAAIYFLMSCMTLGAFWLDKRAARRGSRRIPENSLHLMELLGGFPGAIVGQLMLRHKSYKLRYRLTLGLIIALHAAAWAFWILVIRR